MSTIKISQSQRTDVRELNQGQERLAVVPAKVTGRIARSALVGDFALNGLLVVQLAFDQDISR